MNEEYIDNIFNFEQALQTQRPTEVRKVSKPDGTNKTFGLLV